MVWLSWLGIEAAVACSCVLWLEAPRYVAIPAPGATDVPTNASIRLVGTWERALELGVLTVDDEPWAYTVDDAVDDGLRQMVLDVGAAFPAGARVALRYAGTSTPFLRFEVGDGQDTAAPTWSGAAEVTSDREDWGTCGTASEHEVRLEGLGDDGPVAGVVVVGVPEDPDMAPLLGRGPRVVAERTPCGGDGTLDDRYHRTWDIALIDMAGHVTRGDRVNTRPLASMGGCSHGPGTGGAWWLLLGLGTLAGRRRLRA